MYKRAGEGLQVLLVHPGGPFWAKKDDGVWSIPKGEYGADEAPLSAARREFAEELGIVPRGDCHALGEVKQRGGKIVTAFALESDLEISIIKPGAFEMEWPPKSGRRQSFPEVDRVAWFSPEDARVKILESQRDFIDRLLALVAKS